MVVRVDERDIDAPLRYLYSRHDYPVRVPSTTQGKRWNGGASLGYFPTWTFGHDSVEDPSVNIPMCPGSQGSETDRQLQNTLPRISRAEAAKRLAQPVLSEVEGIAKSLKVH